MCVLKLNSGHLYTPLSKTFNMTELWFISTIIYVIISLALIGIVIMCV